MVSSYLFGFAPPRAGGKESYSDLKSLSGIRWMLGGSISGGSSALDDKYEDRCEERLNVIHILEGLEGFDSKTD